MFITVAYCGTLYVYWQKKEKKKEKKEAKSQNVI